MSHRWLKTYKQYLKNKTLTPLNYVLLKLKIKTYEQTFQSFEGYEKCFLHILQLRYKLENYSMLRYDQVIQDLMQILYNSMQISK